MGIEDIKNWLDNASDDDLEDLLEYIENLLDG